MACNLLVDCELISKPQPARFRGREALEFMVSADLDGQRLLFRVFAFADHEAARVAKGAEIGDPLALSGRLRNVGVAEGGKVEMKVLASHLLCVPGVWRRRDEAERRDL